MKTITICSSAAFYRDVIKIKEELEKLGVHVIVPKTALRMQKNNDYEVSHYKTWMADANDYHKKAELMMSHFEEIDKGGAILVVNNTKHGVENYIGGNVLMEMALAFFQKKPIFILHDIPHESPLIEEVLGVLPITLKGDIKSLVKQL